MYIYILHAHIGLACREIMQGWRSRTRSRSPVRECSCSFFFEEWDVRVCAYACRVSGLSEVCVCMCVFDVCVCVDVCVCWYACVYCSHTRCTRTHACTTHAHIICLFCCGYCLTSQCSLNRFEVDQMCSPSFLIERELCIVHAFMIHAHIICLYSSVYL